eukprot:scaffold17657_cov131-Isochrysis_galbana.AAC.4
MAWGRSWRDAGAHSVYSRMINKKGVNGASTVAATEAVTCGVGDTTVRDGLRAGGDRPTRFGQVNVL